MAKNKFLLQAQSSQARSSETQEASTPSMLSITTTKDQHTAPDGSITTKTVVKKCFADGREESTESVETTPSTGPDAWARQQTGHDRFSAGNEQTQVASKIVNEAKRGKGWFWSS